MLSYPEALKSIVNQSRSFGSETISIHRAQGRVLAKEVNADRPYPPFNRSAMDGFACRSSDLVPEGRTLDIKGTLLAGDDSQFEIHSGEALRIMTGAPVPHGLDAVVPIEQCEIQGDKVKLTPPHPNPWLNIARQGEDAEQGQALLKKGQLIDHAAWSLLATLGQAEVEVAKHPSVTIITTGNEIQPVNLPVASHQIRDSNSFVLRGLLANLGITQVNARLVPDDREQMEAVIQEGLNSDVVILTGGVSMGTADFVPSLLKLNGVEQIFHKVAIKPGKPLWFGTSQAGKIVFGLPGNPLSCQVGFRIFIQPFLEDCFEMPPSRSMELPLEGSKVKKNTLDQFFPGKIMKGQAVEFVPFNGSGDIKASLGSDGLIWHPADVMELPEGKRVTFFPWKTW